MHWLAIATVAYFFGLSAFLFCWARGLPPAENTSRAIRQFEQQRRYQGTNGDWPSIPAAFHNEEVAR